jgi:hypothetical protein
MQADLIGLIPHKRSQLRCILVEEIMRKFTYKTPLMVLSVIINEPD